MTEENSPNLESFTTAITLLNRSRMDLLRTWQNLLLTLPREGKQLHPDAMTSFRRGFNFACDSIIEYLAESVQQAKGHITPVILTTNDRVCPQSSHTCLGLSDSTMGIMLGYDATPKLTISFERTPSEQALILGPLPEPDLLQQLGNAYQTAQNQPSHWVRKPMPAATIEPEAMKRKIIARIAKSITVPQMNHEE